MSRSARHAINRSEIELCCEWTWLVPVIQFSCRWRIGVTALPH